MTVGLEAFSWDIHEFNKIGLSSDDVRKILADQKAGEALKALTNEALYSDKAKKVAAKLPEKQFLHFTIAYDKQKGLELIYKERAPLEQDKVKRLLVAANDELESLEEHLKNLEAHIDAIKAYQKPISLSRKVTPIRTERESSTTSQGKGTQKVFDKLIRENREFEKKKSFIHRIVKAIEVFYVAADVDATIRSSISAATAGAATIVNYMLGVGGGILFLSGISCMIVAGVKAAKAIAHKSYESFFIAIGDILSASGVSALGAALAVYAGATINNLSDLASRAFSVVPYVIIVRSCVDLISAIYQIVIIAKFKMKLAALASDEPETQEIIEALKWLQGILKPDSKQEQNTESRVESIIAQKWQSFQLRAGSKAFELIEKLCSGKSALSLESLIQDLESSSSSSKKLKATIISKEILSDLRSSSTKALGLVIGKVFLSIIALSVGVAMCLDSGASSSVAISVIFAIASAFSVILDSSALQSYLLTKWESVASWLSDHVKKIKDRIEAEDIGIFGKLLDMDKFSEGQKKIAIAIFATLTYLVRNVQDSMLIPFLGKLPLIQSLIDLFSQEDEEDADDNDAEEVSSVRSRSPSEALDEEAPTATQSEEAPALETGT